MRSEMRIRFQVGCAAAALVLMMWVPTSALADEVAGQVTASTGEVEGVNGAGALVEGEHVKLGEEGGCSILVDKDALVELCGQTQLQLRKDTDSNRRIVDLTSGEIKLVVQPRDFHERIEIHTPTAIATLLGTIVHVSIDPVTGATTISSAESKVAVRSKDPKLRGTTVVKALEQVTVEAGEAPPAAPKKLDKVQIAELGGCLVDFHRAALGRDSGDHQQRVAERLTALDVARNSEGGEFSSPGSPGTRRRPLPNPGDDPIVGQDDTCGVTDCSGDFHQPEPDPQSQQSSPQ
jgi:hypothetical protein